jgi:hypothetical protein
LLRQNFGSTESLKIVSALSHRGLYETLEKYPYEIGTFYFENASDTVYALRRNDAKETLNILDEHDQLMRPENLSLNAPAQGKHVTLMLEINARTGNLHTFNPRVTNSQILQYDQGQKSASLKNLRVLTLDFPSMGSATEENVQRRYKKSNVL